MPEETGEPTGKIVTTGRMLVTHSPSFDDATSKFTAWKDKYAPSYILRQYQFYPSHDPANVLAVDVQPPEPGDDEPHTNPST